MTDRIQKTLLALLILWVPLIFFKQAADGFTLTKELAAAVVIAFFAVRTAWEGRWVFRQPLVQAAALFVLWMILDSLGVGVLKMEVLKGSVHLFLILGTLLAVVFASSRGFSYEKALRYALLAGVLTALYGVLQSIGFDIYISLQRLVGHISKMFFNSSWSMDLEKASWTAQFEHRAFATLGNPDYLGGYLAALLPVAFVLTLRDLGKRIAWVWLNATLLMGAALFATRVRGAEAATLAAFLFLAVALLTPWGKELARRNRLFLMAALVLVLSFGGVWLSLHRKSFSRSDVSVQQRLDTYRVAWEMVKDHPWLGIGLGQLGVWIPPYQAKPWVAGDYPNHPYTYTEHVHNEFLQFWVEGGLPGFLFFLGLLGAFAGAVAHFLRNPESGSAEKEILLGACGGLVALLVQSLSNFPLQVAPTAILFGLLLAAPLALRKTQSLTQSHGLSTREKAALALAMVVTAIVGLRAVGASIAFRDTVGESNVGHGQLAVQYGERLIAFSPVNPKAWNAYGKALEVDQQPDQAYQAYQKALDLNPNYVENLLPMADIRINQGRFADATDLCRKALAVTPNYVAMLWPLAVSQFELKQYDESAKAFENYLAFSSNDPQTYLDLGVCYIQLKRKDEAIAAWKKAYSLNPSDPQVVQYLKSVGVNPIP
jgi:O-antigen ligase